MPNFKHYFIIPASPEEVYLALTFTPTIELWTGSPASFQAEPGSEFSMWDGNIIGRNLEFEEGKLIRQEWYFGELNSPSIVTLKFHPHKKGTSLEVEHNDIPEETFEEIVDGWHTIYVKDLVDFYTE